MYLVLCHHPHSVSVSFKPGREQCGVSKLASWMSMMMMMIHTGRDSNWPTPSLLANHLCKCAELTLPNNMVNWWWSWSRSHQYRCSLKNHDLYLVRLKNREILHREIEVEVEQTPTITHRDEYRRLQCWNLHLFIKDESMCHERSLNHVLCTIYFHSKHQIKHFSSSLVGLWSSKHDKIIHPRYIIFLANDTKFWDVLYTTSSYPSILKVVKSIKWETKLWYHLSRIRNPER